MDHPTVAAPDLSVVICTYRRPEELNRAVAAVEAQTHPGPIETIVVFDKTEPDTSLERADGSRPVRTVRNERTPGLPGARNTGFGHARAPVIGLCDDDDVWRPEKASRQLAVLEAEPDIDVVFSGMNALTERGAVRRIPTVTSLTFEALLASRVADAHISSALFRRAALFDRIGLFDEAIPGGYCEDYEWMLRATRAAPAAVVAEALVDVRWGTGSYFADRWRTIDDALEYLLGRVPEFATVPRGLARIEGQQAFACAAAGQRRRAWLKVRRALRHDWRQPRAYLAAVVATGLVPAGRILAALNRRGHGI